MPNLKYKEFLRKVTTEDIVNKMEESTFQSKKDITVQYSYMRNPKLFMQTLLHTKTGKKLKSVYPYDKSKIDSILTKRKFHLLKGTGQDHIDFLKTLNSKGIMPKSKIIGEELEIEEDAPTNSVSAGGVDMAPNAGHPNVMKKHIRRNKKDQKDLTKKISNMVKENIDNNNNILKGVNQTLDKLEDKIDEISGIDNEIKFEEKKEYKTFSEKFKVGK